MKILLLCDDYYHHSETVINGLNYLNKLSQVDIIDDANKLDLGNLGQYKIIIFSKSNNYSRSNREEWMINDVENTFKAYVENGGSLIVVHSGTAGYRNTPVFRELIGGVFIHHPEQCEVKVEPVLTHPISVGVESFNIFDEHYHMDINKNNIEIIFKTISTHGEQPGGWIREVGKGKVFVFTPGHNLAVWHNENFKKIMLNSINWCIN